MKYCVFVLDLKTGETIQEERNLSLEQAISTYRLMAKHYTNYCTGENYIVALYNKEIEIDHVKKPERKTVKAGARNCLIM